MNDAGRSNPVCLKSRARMTPRIGSEEFRSVSIADARFGWHLYFAETYLDHPESYEVIQGARVIPVLAQLGSKGSAS